MCETLAIKVYTIWANKNVWMFAQHGVSFWDRVTEQRGCLWKIPKRCSALSNRPTINHTRRKWKQPWVGMTDAKCARFPRLGREEGVRGDWPAEWFLARWVLHFQHCLVSLCAGQGRQLWRGKNEIDCAVIDNYDASGGWFKTNDNMSELLGWAFINSVILTITNLQFIVNFYEIIFFSFFWGRLVQRNLSFPWIWLSASFWSIPTIISFRALAFIGHRESEEALWYKHISKCHFNSNSPENCSCLCDFFWVFQIGVPSWRVVVSWGQPEPYRFSRETIINWPTDLWKIQQGAVL